MSRLQQQPEEKLEYFYEEDTINLLVRDPHCLYAYWDITDKRKNMLMDALGSEVFNKSVPVLKVTNVTKNESSFIRINDFSTDWYINVQDSGSTYIVEIGRKLPNDFFLSMLNSNSTITPYENVSCNTSACFANYSHVRKGVYELIPDKKARPGFIDMDMSNIPGTGSMEFTRSNTHERIFGISSHEHTGKQQKNTLHEEFRD